MKLDKCVLVGILASLMLTACGGGGGGGGSITAPTPQTGQFIDSPVGGLTYSCTSGSSQANTGTTNAQGQFTFIAGQTCTFKIGNVTIGSMSNIPTDGVVTPQDVAGVSRSATSDPTAVAIAQFLQTLDDGSGNGNIVIPSSVTTALSNSNVSPVTLASATAGVISQSTLTALVQNVGQSVPAYSSKSLVSASSATSALQAQISSGKVNASGGAVNSNTTAVLTSISVTSSSLSVASGLNDQMIATGYYSDGTSKDISSNVDWTSSSESIATVNSAGIVTSVSQGDSSIKAKLGSISANSLIHVTPAILQSLIISPSSPSIAAGKTTSLLLTGIYSDGSNSTNLTGVTWTSSATGIVSIDETGLVTAGVNTGTTNISASIGSTNSSSVTFTVLDPTITSILISSTSNTVEIGRTLVLNALANLSNGISKNVSSFVNWIISSGDTGSASISVNSFANSAALNPTSTGSINVYSNYEGVRSNVISVNIPSFALFSTTPVTIADLTPYFEAMCGGITNIHQVIPIDLNKDGKMDFVVGMWCSDITHSPISTETPNRMVIFIQNNDGTFSDQTKSIVGSNIAKFGGVPTTYIKADFNGDGYDDIVYAVNYEDGRISADNAATNFSTQNSILTSNGDGTYKIVRIGTPAWNYMVRTVKNNSGGLDVLSLPIGYGGITETYSIGNNGWYVSNPAYSAQNFTGPGTLELSANSNSSGSKLAVSSIYYSNYEIDLWMNSANAWSKSDSYKFGNFVQMPYMATGTTQLSTINVILAGGKYYQEIALENTCEAKINENDATTKLIYIFNGLEYTSGIESGVVYQDRLQSTLSSKIYAFDVSSGKLTLLGSDKFKINNENTKLSISPGGFECRDLNGDGRIDFLIENEGKVIYLGDGQGGFSLVNSLSIPGAGLYDLPGNKTQEGYVYADIDGDGISDILTFPGPGIKNYQSVGPNNLIYYKGLRKMQSIDLVP